MKKRLILRYLLIVWSVLFTVFGFVEVKMSIEIFLCLFIILVSIKLFELIKFYMSRNKLLNLGEREVFFNRYLFWLILFFSFFVYVKFVDYLKFDTSFADFFLREDGGTGFILGLLSYQIVTSFLEDKNVFYLSEKGIITKGNR